MCSQRHFLIILRIKGATAEMLLTQFSPEAVGLRVPADLIVAKQAFTPEADSAGVTDQGVTCDRGRRGER